MNHEDVNYENWFVVTAADKFSRYLMAYKGKSNLRFLQIGVFAGDASLWMLENILTGDKSMLFDVDTWQGSDIAIYSSFDMVQVESIYDSRISSYTNVTKRKQSSTTFLENVTETFDFIYVDGDHTSEGVYSDARLSWPLLKPGGILAFDDYTWVHESGDAFKTPQPAIDIFLEEMKGELQILERTNQVWVRKNIC